MHACLLEVLFPAKVIQLFAGKDFLSQVIPLQISLRGLLTLGILGTKNSGSCPGVFPLGEF